jgi:hypothetical protein
MQRMRTTLATLFALAACFSTKVHALEVRSEVTVGRDFAYLTNDVGAELLDGQLGLGGGMTMVSDFINERYGAQGLIEYRGEKITAGLEASFGPRQLARGWATLDPHVELHFEVDRWLLRGQGGVLLRRVDATAQHKPFAVDQLQLHLDLEASFDDCWLVGAFALYSFYDPDPAQRALRGFDLGLAITLAGRPERWAVGGRIGARLVSWLRAEIGIAGVSFVDGTGNAIVPRIVLRLGPWRGFSISTSLDVAVNVADESPDQVREIAGIELGFER